MRIYTYILLIATISLSLVQPWSVSAQTINVLYVSNSTNDLLSAGCQQLETGDQSGLAAALALKWQTVIPPGETGTLLVCAPQVASQLTVTGQAGLAGLFDVPAAQAQGEFPPDFPMFSEESAPAREEAGIIVKELTSLFTSLKLAGDNLFDAGSRGFEYLLSANPAGITINTLWVTILGIVNLFYLLILVGIALFTVLKIDLGGGVQRLLPRLLLSALLVNFSLVISLAVLDIVSIGIASLTLMSPTMSPGSQSDLFTSIRRSSSEIEGGIYALISGERGIPGDFLYSNWDYIAALIIASFSAWTNTIALLLLLAFLVLRWLILALLIVFSPAAYLLIALPNMGNLAAKWWRNFLGWAFFPLGVIFILWLTTKAVDSGVNNNPFFFPSNASTSITRAQASAVRSIISSIILSTGLISAIVFGKISANVGTSALLSAASQARRGLVGGAVGGAALGLAGLGLAARGAYVATGARRATRYIGGAASALRERSPFLKRLFATKEETRAAGRAAVESRTKMPSTPIMFKSKEEKDRANKAVADARSTTGAARAGKISQADLANRNIGATLARQPKDATTGRTALQDVARYGDAQKIHTLVRSKAIMNELNDQQKVQLMIEIRNNYASTGSPLKENDVNKLHDELQKSIASGSTGTSVGGTP